MRKPCIYLATALCVVGWLLFQGTTPGAAGEQGAKADAGSKEARWSGTIVRSNDKVSTLTVRKGHIEKIVHFESSTRWTEGTKDIDRSEIKDGDRVICLGKFNEKGELIATRVDKRKPGAGAFH